MGMRARWREIACWYRRKHAAGVDQDVLEFGQRAIVRPSLALHEIVVCIDITVWFSVVTAEVLVRHQGKETWLDDTVKLFHDLIADLGQLTAPSWEEPRPWTTVQERQYAHHKNFIANNLSLCAANVLDDRRKEESKVLGRSSPV